MNIFVELQTRNRPDCLGKLNVRYSAVDFDYEALNRAEMERAKEENRQNLEQTYKLMKNFLRIPKEMP